MHIGSNMSSEELKVPGRTGTYECMIVRGRQCCKKSKLIKLAGSTSASMGGRIIFLFCDFDSCICLFKIS